MFKKITHTVIQRWNPVFLLLLSSSCFAQSQNANLLLAGTLDYCDGLGKIVYNLTHYLQHDLKVAFSNSNVSIFYQDPYQLRKQVNRVPDNHKTDIYFYTNPIIALATNDCYKDADQNAIKIAYTMFEASKIPDYAVNILNEQFDVLLVPDPFLFEVYRDSGVTKPIYCIPTGLNLEPFLELDDKERDTDEPFVFGCASNDVCRKNLKKLLDAFIKRYGNNPNYQFKLQTKFVFNEDTESLEEYVERLGVTNVFVNADIISDEEYVDFIAGLDCYILASTGEGFSNTPREAMAAGIPVAVTNNTGHITLCNSGFVTKIPSTIKIDAYYEALRCNVGCQYDCEIDDIIKAMEHIETHYDACLEKAKQGRKWVAQYLWPQLKQDFLAFFDPEKVILSNENKLDTKTRTIYTSDKNFYNKVEHLIAKRSHDVTLTAPSGFCDGLGRIGPGIVDALQQELSIGFYLSPLRDTAYGQYINLDDPYNFKEKLQYTSCINRSPVFLHLGCVNSYMQDLAYQSVDTDKIRYSYTMFESSRIPEKTIARLNQYFDAIIVPDPYYVDVYKDSGLTIPAFCVPTGLYLEHFLEQPIKEQITTGKPFTFGCIATNGPRKNLKKLIEIFAENYGNNPNFCLKIHAKKSRVGNMSFESAQAGIAKLCNQVEAEGKSSLGEFFKNLETYDTPDSPETIIKDLGLTNVILTDDIMTEEQYINYFKTIDCYIFISKGEGFSNTPREALALGIPTIVTSNTAQKTICDSGTVVSVASDIAVPASYNVVAGNLGYHYDCKKEDVVAAMDYVINNYAACLKQAAQGREWVKQYLWPNLKNQFKTLFKPETVKLGDSNYVDATTGTLITNSPTFYEKWNNLSLS